MLFYSTTSHHGLLKQHYNAYTSFLNAPAIILSSLYGCLCFLLNKGIFFLDSVFSILHLTWGINSLGLFCLPSSLSSSFPLSFLLSFEGILSSQALYEPTYTSRPQRVEFLSKEVSCAKYRNKSKRTGFLHLSAPRPPAQRSGFQGASSSCQVTWWPRHFAFLSCSFNLKRN